MREFVIHGCMVRVFKDNLVKIYAPSQEIAAKIWDYLQEENLILTFGAA